MIVVDTNVIAYLFIDGNYSEQSKVLLKHDSDWISPFLWKSEFRNVLVLYIKQGFISLADAQLLMHEAEDFMSGNEYEVNSYEILELVSDSTCSAYDCEFVALAKRLNLSLFTSDKRILKDFPGIASSLKDFKLQ